MKAEQDTAAQKRLARELALPIRRELVARVADVYKYLLSAVTTYGELGNVTNWQQHVLPSLLDEPGRQLAQLLGESLPDDALPGKQYQGPPRLFVPVVRTALTAGESLAVRVVVLGAAGKPTLFWRPLGKPEFTSVGGRARGPRRVPGRSAGRGDSGGLRVLPRVGRCRRPAPLPPDRTGTQPDGGGRGGRCSQALRSTAGR